MDHFRDGWFFGWFLFGLAVFVLLILCLVVGSANVQQDRITQRQRIHACASIKNESVRALCINGQGR